MDIDKRVYYLIPNLKLATLDFREPPNPYMTKKEYVFLGREALGMTAAAHLSPEQLQAIIPLEYTRHKRFEECYERGAVWALRLITRHTCEKWVVTGTTVELGGEITVHFTGIDPQNFQVEGDSLNINSRELDRYVDLRRCQGSLHNNPADMLYRALYCGHLPALARGRFFAGVEMSMEDVNYKVDVARGPKITTTVHRLALSDLDPQETTVDSIKQLKLTLFPAIELLIGIDIQRVLQADNPVHQTIAQMIAAWCKPGYLVHPKKAEMHDTLFPATLNGLIRALLPDPPRARFTDDVTAVIQPHASAEDPAMISYYSGINDMIRGRLTTSKTGKVIRKYYPDRIDDETVKTLTNEMIVQNSPATFEILTDPVEIVAAYKDGPSSCVAKPIRSFTGIWADVAGEINHDPLSWDPRYHPAAIYGGDSDTALAVMRKNGKVFARAVLNTDRKQCPRVYGREGTKSETLLTEWLIDQGYTFAEHALWGATVRQIFTPTGNIIKPYIDRQNPAVMICDTESSLMVVNNPRENSSQDATEVFYTPKADALMRGVRTNWPSGWGSFPADADTVKFTLYNTGYSSSTIGKEISGEGTKKVSFCPCCDTINVKVYVIANRDGSEVSVGCNHCLDSNLVHSSVYGHETGRANVLYIFAHTDGTRELRFGPVLYYANSTRLQEVTALAINGLTTSLQPANAARKYHALPSAIDYIRSQRDLVTIPGRSYYCLPQEVVRPADHYEDVWFGDCAGGIRRLSDGTQQFHYHEPDSIESVSLSLVAALLLPTSSHPTVCADSQEAA